jgi:hypothetical protein
MIFAAATRERARHASDRNVRAESVGAWTRSARSGTKQGRWSRRGSHSDATGTAVSCG